MRGFDSRQGLHLSIEKYMADIPYRQFSLSSPSPEGGTSQLVTWLPEKHRGTKLVPGTRITLRDESGEINPRIWTVQTVSTETRSEAEVREQERAWTKWRSVTDV